MSLPKNPTQGVLPGPYKLFSGAFSPIERAIIPTILFKAKSSTGLFSTVFLHRGHVYTGGGGRSCVTRKYISSALSCRWKYGCPGFWRTRAQRAVRWFGIIGLGSKVGLVARYWSNIVENQFPRHSPQNTWPH